MDAQRLDEFELFQGLDDEALDFFAGRMHEVTVPIGAHLVKAGDYAYKLFVIFGGSAAVSRGDAPVATLERGEIFGEMALIEDSPRNADVVAITELSVGTLMSWDFREAMDRFPGFRARVEALIDQRS